LKRAWRISDFFQKALKDNIGGRTKEMGKRIFKDLKKKGKAEKKAKNWAKEIAGVFVKKIRDQLKQTLYKN
jgi:CRISPR system Cascade subunit CasC